MSAGIGQFTGDALQSGYALGRNSSRVLAPPGGKCSNIFGDAYVAPANENREVAEAKRNSSTVFRSPVAAETSYSRQQAAQRRNQSNIFSEPYEAPQSPTRRSAPDVTEDANERRGSNARHAELHGERSQLGPASGKARAAVHTSSRVLAPPGGRSSNIFNL